MIIFSANTRRATALSDDVITTRSVGIPVSLVLSSEFDGLAKTFCARNGTAAVDVVLVGDEVNTTLPADVLLTPGQLQIGVFAADESGNIVIPTVWALVGQIKPGATPAGVDPSTPTPSWPAQVQQIAAQAMENSEQAIATANEAKEAAITAQDSASASAEAAAGSASAAAGSAAGAAQSASDAAESETNASGSAAEATTKAGEAASAATAAYGAASAAAQSAAAAAQSASNAADSAASASGSAETATTKAGEAASSATSASGSASTATTKAGEASSSAAAASGSASSAAAAQTAAENAQDAAETAQTAAETAAQSVSASAAQIQQNADDITDLKSQINGLPNLEKTVNGYVAYNYESGKGLNSSGEVVDNADRCVSDKIPYTWTGDTRYYCGDNTTDTYNICFYNASDVLLQRYKNPAYTGGAVYRHITAPEGTSYVRFDFKKNYVGYCSANITSDSPVYWIATTTEVDGLSDKVQEIEELMVPDYGLCISASAATLATGDDPLIAVTNMDIRKNDITEFHADITSITDLTVGHGYEINQGTYLVVDGTNLSVYNANTDAAGTLVTQQAHGLTLSIFVNVVIDRGNNGTATIELTTGTGQYRWENVAFSGGRDSVFALCTGSLTNAKLTAGFKDFNQPFFFFGDSYMSMGSNARWPYYAIQNGWDKFLACGFPGANGWPHGIPSFRNIIARAKPRYVVWCLGMNGGVSDSNKAVDEVIETCDALGVEVVLSTTPCVPDPAKNNEAKNTHVKSTGKRYIDFAKAVGAETNGSTWYAGMLSYDNLHPSALGAKALYAQVLKDFPEIMR